MRTIRNAEVTSNGSQGDLPTLNCKVSLMRMAYCSSARLARMQALRTRSQAVSEWREQSLVSDGSR